MLCAYPRAKERLPSAIMVGMTKKISNPTKAKRRTSPVCLPLCVCLCVPLVVSTCAELLSACQRAERKQASFLSQAHYIHALSLARCHHDDDESGQPARAGSRRNKSTKRRTSFTILSLCVPHFQSCTSMPKGKLTIATHCVLLPAATTSYATIHNESGWVNHQNGIPRTRTRQPICVTCALPKLCVKGQEVYHSTPCPCPRQSDDPPSPQKQERAKRTNQKARRGQARQKRRTPLQEVASIGRTCRLWVGGEGWEGVCI